MAAPEAVRRLVERFAEQHETYRQQQYNETQVRREFIDPLFGALGWDIDNRKGKPNQYKDVIHEDAIKVGGLTKAPDYCFKIGGDRKFFVEAKKPAVPLASHQDSAYQLKRYAWSAKLPLGILTDFEEIAVYDCRLRPKQSDPVTKARLFYFKFSDLSKRWKEFSDLFSRQAVENGSLDEFTTAKARGSATVDKEFLKEIERWRELLAKNIAVRNRKLTTEELNTAVQRTIDRLIFLRICEDRGIESYGRLMALQNSNRTYEKLVEIFRYADKRYNSGLFHFAEEHGRVSPVDTLSLNLNIDDEPLQDIIKHLYYPDSPYEFSVLPTEILGQVYEQFLGKVIRLTSGHHAKIEEKPEVRKAGGVYYTPRYIVDYIVKQTVGELVNGKRPAQVAKLKVLDPACGSGSFLLGAYQYLLDWHRDWYVEDDAKGKRPKHSVGKNPVLYKAAGGEWRLTAPEKRRILLNNIHGVDIDAQAVEVTKLSLLLKVLEDVSLNQQFGLLQERALPDLGNNIKCGNSLIGHDYFTGQMLPDEDEVKRINPFDWEDEFPEIMRGGGFDAVIGNPPYVYRNSGDDAIKNYFLKFKSAEGNYELYKFFLERGIGLLKDQGRLGMIISASFLIQNSFTKLRQILIEQSSIEKLAPLGPNVFLGATVDSCVLVLRQALPKDKHNLAVITPDIPTELQRTDESQVKQGRFQNNEKFTFDYRLSAKGYSIVSRLFSEFPQIESGYKFGVGINTGFIRSELVSNSQKNKKYHPLVLGTGVSRYEPVQTKGWILYDRKFVESRGKLGRTLPEESLLKDEKILVVRTRNLSLQRRVIATIDKSSAYNLNRLSNITARQGFSLSGLLGLLNSNLFNWIFSTKFYDYEIKPIYLRHCPLANANDKTLVAAVNNMLTLHSRLDNESSEKIALGRHIKSLDRQIDQTVYKLYGLTDAEIKIIENSR